jgi:hypothetical protein
MLHGIRCILLPAIGRDFYAVIIIFIFIYLFIYLFVSNLEEPPKFSEDETLTAPEYKSKGLPPHLPVYFGLTEALRKPHIRRQK